jgi:hypothetical protein
MPDVLDVLAVSCVSYMNVISGSAGFQLLYKNTNPLNPGPCKRKEKSVDKEK